MAVKIKAVCSVLLSLLFLGGAFTHYCTRMNDCAEMTFLSNAATGVVFLCCGLYSLFTKKSAPHFLYFDCAVLLACVVAVCAYFASDVCFTGRSVILHLVTPASAVLFYIFFCDARTGKKRDMITALVFPTVYYIFMITLGKLTGQSVYSYFDVNVMSNGMLVVMFLFAESVLIVIGVCLAFVNRLLRRFINGGAAIGASKN